MCSSDLAPLLVVVNSNQKAATLKEFFSQAQASPGKLNYGSAGPGSAIHLSSELFVRQAKLRINHVPYRGGGALAGDDLLVPGQRRALVGERGDPQGHDLSDRRRPPEAAG